MPLTSAVVSVLENRGYLERAVGSLNLQGCRPVEGPVRRRHERDRRRCDRSQDNDSRCRRQSGHVKQRASEGRCGKQRDLIPLVASAASISSKKTTSLPTSPDGCNDFGCDFAESPSPRQENARVAEMDMPFAKWTMSDYRPWSCVACTYVNVDPRHLMCNVCGEERSADKTIDDSLSSMIKSISWAGGDCPRSESQSSFSSSTSSSSGGIRLMDSAEYLTDIEKERMAEHVEMQRRIIEEIEIEKLEYDQRMDELSRTEENMIAMAGKSRGLEESGSGNAGSDVGGGADTNYPARFGRDYHQAVVSLRSQFQRQRNAIKASSKRIQLLSAQCPRTGRVDISRAPRRDDEEEQRMLGKMRREWIERELQLESLRRKMQKRFVMEERKWREGV